ncbi:(2Fe-2S)-binding protein [Halalkalicoccus jeotgali]|uniref:(2Fe-2S)-binding domain protein n=1 Tax=Halalkalicoccus jeotgali (strain DSM 18796 / CECT 7217 / JCM 14584 / KCTC 4019 / B3) TaxID=795797 RepID=D8JBC6_HALJB|nr:(2Fe-2S)-binding protein [Halalkalicoccus jeotgali]ADJ16579.1 (2Fe-2S)-binding domain protein [Halalkalicoccus jeotgali B3]ELY41325.1 (2Fe-2S)-binding domain-containing protein [Halalkalicoccus jeotgali B3]
MEIDITLNGAKRTFEAERSDSLLDVLRCNGYTGAKRGCDTGNCGFCTVVVDGEPERSCIKPVATIDGATVETIESLGTQDDLHPIQAAFVDNAALQCGFCIPGMIMQTRSLLADTPDPTEAEIRDGLSGNLCRCTGYEKIIDAVQDAAGRMNDEQTVATDGGDTVVAPNACSNDGCPRGERR